MGVLHGLLVAWVIGLIAVAPCLVCALLLSADEVVARVVGWGRRVVPKKRRAKPVGPPIEQVAGDLRRLNRLRESVAQRSRVWYVAVQEAYDEGLRTAAGQLGVEEHIEELTGVDRELERLRVEGELQRAGLVLRNQSAQQR